MNIPLRPAAAAAYEPVQKHKVAPGIPGDFIARTHGYVRNDSEAHETVLYKLRSVQNTGTCYPGQGWFVRNLGCGR